MQRVEFGTRVRSISIPRVQIAAGMKGRAVVIDKSPMVKQIAYDDVNKIRVEVTQQECIESHLTPRANFFMLVARLNTDMKGNIVDSDISVEYLQMSERVYNEFADTALEFGDFNSILMVSQTSNGQSQFAYVKPTPSNAQIPAEVMEKIKKLQETPGMIDGCWQMIDQATSITYQQYLQRLSQASEQPQAQVRQFAPPQPKAQIAAPQYHTPSPKPQQKAQPKVQQVQESPEPFEPAEEFSGEEFGGDFDDSNFS